MLHGRRAECDALERLLADARRSRSGVLVVRGEAGVGKSALLDHAAGRAEGMAMLRAGGVESEAELPFAALHQLLRPVLGLVGRLPDPQAAALGSALGLGPPATARPSGTASWSRWPCSACSPRRPRTGRCCAWSMRPSGWTSPRPRP